MIGLFWFVFSIAAIVIVVRLIGKAINATANDAGFDTTPIHNKAQSKESHIPFDGYRKQYYSQYDDVDKQLNSKN